MALDTRDKRLSILEFYSPASINLPDPDGAFDVYDRQQILGGYSGIEWQQGSEYFETYQVAFNIDLAKTMLFGIDQAKTISYDIETTRSINYDI